MKQCLGDLSATSDQEELKAQQNHHCTRDSTCSLHAGLRLLNDTDNLLNGIHGYSELRMLHVYTLVEMASLAVTMFY